MEQEFLTLLNKVINDEVSAAIFYKRAAAELIGAHSQNIAKELKIHATEELEHFDMLFNYASNYDLLAQMNIVLDDEVANFPIGSTEQVMVKVQELEHIAINDYQRLLMMSKEMKDFSGIELFKELLEDEIGHFDDLAYVLGQTRNLFITDADANGGPEDGIELAPTEINGDGEPTSAITPIIESAKTAASVLNANNAGGK